MGSAYREEFINSEEISEELPMLELDDDAMEDETRIVRRRESRCQDVDSGWSWVVLMCAFIMFMLGNGAQFAFGVLYSPIRRHFQTTKAMTSWILLLQRGTGSVFGNCPTFNVFILYFLCIIGVNLRNMQLYHSDR